MYMCTCACMCACIYTSIRQSACHHARVHLILQIDLSSKDFYTRQTIGNLCFPRFHLLFNLPHLKCVCARARLPLYPSVLKTFEKTNKTRRPWVAVAQMASLSTSNVLRLLLPLYSHSDEHSHVCSLLTHRVLALLACGGSFQVKFIVFQP
jgi:hypothetical protein